MRRFLFLATAAFVVLALLVPAAASAKKKKKKRKRPPAWYEYSVPFACGQNAILDGLVPGDYAFTLYLSNGQPFEIATRQEVAITSPPGGGAPGPISEPVLVDLMADEATQLTCSDLLGGVFMFAEPPDTSGVVQGLVRVTSRAPLQVTGLQSVLGAGGTVSISEAPVRDSLQQPPAAEPDTVEICHRPPGNPGNAKTLTVGRSSWPAHAAHGDSLGDCDELDEADDD